MRRPLVLLVALVMIFAAATVSADCQYWRCYNDGTVYATCDIYYCSGSGCNDAYFALSCGTRCDLFGCWCVQSGQCFYI